MNRISYILISVMLAVVMGCSHNEHSDIQDSPYAGMEDRDIKAMTPQEVEGYLNGMGMELSMVAELNQYPGPRHVLELADQLDLTSQQKEQTEALFNEMEEKAIEIGKTYIAKERDLNEMFVSGNVSSTTVDSLLVEIGKMKGTLRAIHVNTHIKMKEILTQGQVEKYDELRGYGNGNATHHEHS